MADDFSKKLYPTGVSGLGDEEDLSDTEDEEPTEYVAWTKCSNCFAVSKDTYEFGDEIAENYTCGKCGCSTLVPIEPQV